jgi:hypothetical protein
MCTKGKYVVGKITDNVVGVDLLCAVVIPEHIGHADIRKIFVEGSIIGAGFFQVGIEQKVFVFGKSIGLGIASRPEDAKEIEKALGLSTWNRS